jgi:EmrB/QacA subfamily drug resistance transporter
MAHSLASPAIATVVSPSVPQTRPWTTLVVASAASFMAGLDALVVSTALPTVRRDLHASEASMGWIVTAYLLAFAGMVLTGSAFGDRFGRRRVFLIGIGVFTAASAACALASTPGLLVAARAVQGAGGGIAVPLTLAFVTAAFPASRRGTVVGVWGAISGLAVGLGPVVGGAIVQGLTWQWVFWVNVPVGVGVLVAGRRTLQESFGAARGLDPFGLVLAAGAVLALTDALLTGPQRGWDGGVVALLVGAVVLALACAGWERRATSPIVPAGLFTRAFAAACATRGLLAACLFGSMFVLPQYLQLVLGYGPLAVGAAVLPLTAPVIVLAPLAGRVADRFGDRLPVVTGIGCQGAAYALLSVTVSAGSSYPAMLAPLLLAGVGAGLAYPTTISAALRTVTPQQVGVASGTVTTVNQLGGALGVAVAGALLGAAGASPAGLVDAVRPALLAVAVLAGLAALCSLVPPKYAQVRR